MTQLKEERISPYIHSSITDKISRFTDCSTKTQINEILQNSRRGGATEVVVTTHREENSNEITVKVVDNGNGIEHARYLVGFGAGEFTEALPGEDPAGVGTFSLANCVSTVKSRNWSVNLSPEVFCGEEEAVVKYSDDFIEGTEISFKKKELSYQDSVRDIRRDIPCYPIKVTVDGEEIPQYESYAKYVEDQVSDYNNRINRMSDDDTYAVKTVDYMDGIKVTMVVRKEGNYKNFYWSDCGVTRSNTTWFNGQIVSGGQISYKLNAIVSTHVEITKLNGLALKLPDRTGYVENEELSKLAEFIDYETCRFFAEVRGNNHNLPFSSYTYIKEKGIEIAEAVPDFTIERYLVGESDIAPHEWYFHTSMDDGYYSCGKGLEGKSLFIISGNGELYDLFNISAALYFGNLKDVEIVKDRHSAYGGYSWYDEVPVIESISMYAPSLDNDKSDINLMEDSWSEKDINLSKLYIELEFDREVRINMTTSKRHVMRTPFISLIEDPDNEVSDSMSNWVADIEYYKQSANEGRLEDNLAIINRYHSYDWESEGQTYDDSMNIVAREAKAVAAKYLGVSKRAVAERRWVDTYRDELGVWNMPDDVLSVTLECKAGFGLKSFLFKYEDGEASEIKA
jgi:hypothetical protein